MAPQSEHRFVKFDRGRDPEPDPAEESGLFESVRKQFIQALHKQLPRALTNNVQVEPTHVDVLNPERFQVVFRVVLIRKQELQMYYTVQPAVQVSATRPVDENEVFAPFPSRLEIPHRQWVAWRHDRDPLFSRFPHLLPAVRPEELPEAIRADSAQNGRIVQVVRQLIRYRPGTRATWKYLVTRQTGTGQLAPDVYFAKLYRKAERAEQYYHNTREIYRLLHQRAVPVRVPEPVAIEPEQAVVWYRQATGQVLVPRKELSEKNACLTDLAESLVEFHALPVREFQLKDYTPVAELTRVKKIRRKIRETYPEFAPLMEKVEQVLTRMVPTGEHVVALLHGTFRTNHILVSRCCFYFLDLDSLGSGPPEFDLANFQTALYFQALMGRVPLTVAQEFGNRFLYCYQKFNRAAFRPELYHWYRLDLLFRKQFYKILRQNNPPPARLLNRIRQEMEKVLNEFN